MREERIEVVTYAGFKGEERPMSLIIRGKRIEIVTMWESSVEQDFVSRTRKRSFVVNGSDGVLYRVYYYEDSGEWSGKALYNAKVDNEPSSCKNLIDRDMADVPGSHYRRYLEVSEATFQA